MLELLVVLIVALVLVGVFLDRTLYYKELAEKSAMEQTAWDIRSSVNLRVAELVLVNRFSDLEMLARQNPMDLLAETPPNYLGVRTNPDPATVADGGWYYDNASNEVVYCVVLGRNFVPDAKGRKCAAWRVNVVGGATPGSRPQWARFELARPFKWF